MAEYYMAKDYRATLISSLRSWTHFTSFGTSAGFAGSLIIYLEVFESSFFINGSVKQKCNFTYALSKLGFGLSSLISTCSRVHLTVAYFAESDFKDDRSTQALITTGFRSFAFANVFGLAFFNFASYYSFAVGILIT